MAKELPPVRIKFAAIEIISKEIIAPTFQIELTAEYIFETLSDIQVVAEKKLAISSSDVKIKEKEHDVLVAAFKVVCIYEFPEFEKVFSISEENQYDMPEDIEILLKMTSLSTTRGVVFSELRGTFLHAAIMPLIDLITPIKENRQKALDKKEPI